jgi:hypothetical protein
MQDHRCCGRMGGGLLAQSQTPSCRTTAAVIETLLVDQMVEAHAGLLPLGNVAL